LQPALPHAAGQEIHCDSDDDKHHHPPGSQRRASRSALVWLSPPDGVRLVPSLGLAATPPALKAVWLAAPNLRPAALIRLRWRYARCGSRMVPGVPGDAMGGGAASATRALRTAPRGRCPAAPRPRPGRPVGPPPYSDPRHAGAAHRGAGALNPLAAPRSKRRGHRGDPPRGTAHSWRSAWRVPTGAASRCAARRGHRPRRPRAAHRAATDGHDSGP
jgi:hypothetical protein